MLGSNFVADPNHWAFKEGATAGRLKDTAQRGIMAFGLGCAKERIDAFNTKQWLAGFDAGAKEVEAAPVPAATGDEWTAMGRKRAYASSELGS